MNVSYRGLVAVSIIIQRDISYVKRTAVMSRRCGFCDSLASPSRMNGRAPPQKPAHHEPRNHHSQNYPIKEHSVEGRRVRRHPRLRRTGCAGNKRGLGR
ncbi:hypothetical protein GCM10012278_59620 [Nonomuraea glycinis]|uniref:Uncharacterized protein n=1 Tax=Nonomuraea glycinis TaxID=2047744 RepID=A0A918ABN6_9ACTN|nr:hypothetical protein GCM10012278_59620 [Nonomuraea glycinis]